MTPLPSYPCICQHHCTRKSSSGRLKGATRKRRNFGSKSEQSKGVWRLRVSCRGAAGGQSPSAAVKPCKVAGCWQYWTSDRTRARRYCAPKDRQYATPLSANPSITGTSREEAAPEPVPTRDVFAPRNPSVPLSQTSSRSLKQRPA